MSARSWIVDLGEKAEREFTEILLWTTENFGAKQADVYADLLIAAFSTLSADPFMATSHERDEIGKGLRTLHVSRPGRHILIYRVVADKIVQIVRILHDSMELSRHVPPEKD